MRTIAIVNQKGGCGKTTTAINLAGVFAQFDKRTLLVDLDPQSHCAAGLAIPEGRIDVHIGDALLTDDQRSVDWTRLLWRVSRNLDLAPSTVRLAGLEAARGGLATLPSPEQRLGGVLGRVRDQYDWCVIDCPPTIGLLTFNAVCAADVVLVPVETSFFALQGAGRQQATIAALTRKLGVSPMVRFMAAMHQPGNPLACDMLAQMHERFGQAVLPVVIRFDARLREAVSFGQPIVDYARESAGAEDYIQLARLLASEAFAAEPAERHTARAAQAPAAPAASPSVPSVAQLAAHRPAAPSPGRVSPAPVARRHGPMVSAPPPAAEVAPVAPTQRLRATVVPPGDSALATVPGVWPEPGFVRFVQPLSLGERVCVAGAFNNWSPFDLPLTPNDDLGVLEARLALPAGRYEYKLVVDGRWIADPFNPRARHGTMGDTSSVFEVSPEGAMTAA